MTTYYVSPAASGGSDANNGLGPDASHATNKPFATIGKLIAAGGVLANGDIAYLAPGIYRQSVTAGITSPTSEAQILGDPANAKGFKDSSGNLLVAGDVRWTCYNTDDLTAPASAAVLTLSGRDFLTFRYINFVGTITGTTAQSLNITFQYCTFIPGSIAGDFLTYTGLADIAANWLIDSCIFVGSVNRINITLPTSAIADYDSNIQFKNCLNINGTQTFVTVTASGALAFKGGGVDVFNCTYFGNGSLFNTASANVSTTIPCTVYNSIGGSLTANTLGQIVEDNNFLWASTPRTNVAVGANSVSGVTYSMLFEIGQAIFTGRQPRQFFMPLAGSPFLGKGATAGGPSVDLLSISRPAGGGSTSYAWGAMERSNTGARETSVVDAGSNAAKITGPGTQDLFIPVDASLTTITIRVRYDTNHGTTNKPQVTLMNGEEIGVTTETKTATVGVDTYETLTFTSFTPSAKGIITLRCISRAAAGSGIAYFDTVTGGAQGSQGLDYYRRGEILQGAVASAMGGGPGGSPVLGGFIVQ